MLLLQSVKGYNIFICGANDSGRRLDRVLKKLNPDLPAGLIYSGIRKGLIRVNGKKTIQSSRVENNDEIWISDRLSGGGESVKPDTDGSSVSKLEKLIIRRTDNLLLVSKPAGMLTHGDKSLAALVGSGLTGIEPSLSFRPAPLHRLDRNTSGLVAVSLTIEGASHFSELMRDRKIRKTYLGISLNGPAKEIRLETNLKRSGLVTTNAGGEGGKTGITTAAPLLESDGFTLTLFRIETGVTHQIRAQASAAGFPLAGDVKYGGGQRGFKTFYLHSYSLSLDGYDDICGFESCTAPLTAAFRRRAESIFGAAALDDSLRKIN